MGKRPHGSDDDDHDSERREDGREKRARQRGSVSAPPAQQPRAPRAVPLADLESRLRELTLSLKHSMPTAGEVNTLFDPKKIS